MTAEHETGMKWTSPTSTSQETQQVRRLEPITDEPFLNRVSQEALWGNATTIRESFREATEPGGLIFGLIHLRSSTFISIRINATMQVTDVHGLSPQEVTEGIRYRSLCGRGEANSGRRDPDPRVEFSVDRLHRRA